MDGEAKNYSRTLLGFAVGRRFPAPAPLAFGDDYQFIISGDPVAAATVNSHSAESATAALDGVNRTFAESATTHLYTDKQGPTMIIIR